MICCILTIAFVFLFGCCFGYAISVRDGLSYISKIIQQIELLDNQWVAYSIYKDLLNKYDTTVKEYEQYKGCIKAFKDFNGEK